MKFLYALFAGAAVASSIGSPVVKRATLVERDAAAVSSALASISDQTKKLDTAVKGFSGAGDVASLQSASESLISTLKSATSSISSGGDLSQSDALTLPQPVQDLSKLVQTATQDVIDKKSALVGAGVGSVVYSQLVEIRDNAKKFSDTLVGKVPDSLQNIATNLANPINEALDNAVQKYEDQKDAGGSSGSASGSASATGSASASATASGSASESSAAGGSYPTGSTPSATASGSGSYTTAPGAVSPSSNGTGSYSTGSSPPIATGAANKAAAGYGVAAVAALAVVAAF